MTFYRIYKLFLWKNGKHILFHWISLSLILIGCIAALFIYLQATNSIKIYSQVTYDNDTQNEGILKSYFAGGDNDFIYYSPTNKQIDELMESVRLDLSISSERILPFQNPDDMFLAIEEKNNAQSFAILFKNISSLNGLDYAISSMSNRASTAITYLNDKEVVGIKEFDEYISSGFFTLQQVIDKNFMKIHIGKEPDTEIEVAPLPNRKMIVYDSSTVITFAVLYSLLLCILLLITFLVPMVEEKQNGVKEFLNLTTPYSFLNGVTFYFIRFWIYFVYSFLAILLAYIYNSIGIISIHYILLLFLLFVCSAMCYTMFVSVFFSTVFYAKAAGALLLFVPCVLFFAEGSILQHYPFFFSETTFLEGMRIFQIFTNKHKICSFNDLFINITPSSYRLIDIYTTLLIQCIVYSLLYLYLSFIFPGPGGISQPFHYFLKPSFYNSLFTQPPPQSSNGSYNNYNINENAILKIKNLTKIVGSCCGENKKIINNLVLNIFDNRITVLLGHNGAGKTTTINMIIGAVDKTSGEISVCGFKDPSSYRHLIGYCPQYSIFMEYLNCFEHLKFFAQLRGLDEYEAEKVSNSLLSKLHLVDKANEPGKNLSGGMKRRLSLGMAVTGNTKLIILDEPSSGLDPESRRQLWDILLELRKSQSILLTTHFMEEAEVLGDDVAILSHGKLICEGKPMSLKRKFKCGYILKLLIKEDQFESKKTMDLINSEIPNAKIKVLINPTLCVNLPYEYQHKYPAVLKKLEENASLLGINSISITNSSLEDVFLNCTSSDEVDSMTKLLIRTNDTYMHIKDDEKSSTSHSPKFAQQSFAILYKKFIFLKRLSLYSLFMFSLPFIAIGISFFIINSQRLHASSTTALNLNLQHLPKSEIILKISPEIDAIKDSFIDVMKNTNSKPYFIIPHQKLHEELLKLQHNNLADFYENVMGAVDVSGDNNGRIHIKIFYSTNIIHSSSIMLNLIDNVLLKYFSKDNIEIETSNIPVRKVVEISPAKLEYYAYIVPVGWFFYMLYYISLPFEEDKTEFKKLQNISSLVYWSSFTFYDILLHAFVCFLTYIFQKSLPFHEIYDDNELLWLTTTFMFYGYAYLPILYICSSAFKSLSTLTAFLFSFFIISTIIPDITSANKAAMDEYSGIIAILSFLPDFSIKHQIKVINENFFLSRRNLLISSKKIGLNDDLIKLNLTGKQEENLDITTFYFYSAAILILCEIFLIFVWENTAKRQTILDCFELKCLWRKNNKTESVDYDEEDEVRREKDEVDSIFTKHLEAKYPLIVSKLQKSYGNLLAVNQISFAVKQGECFGLLGLNGAGKTSTFEMITGNMKVNGGNSLIDRVSVHKNINTYKSLIGYCPQGNALICHMTSYEILKYMAMIRGIRNPNNEVRKWLEQLDLVRYKNIPICKYSGGTKRKLNTAIAMIGNPKVLFLDEPTAGVDPKSRRFIWKCIQKFQNDNKTIVLTSHSMDECENLCNRLAIMAKGRFQCIGYIPILKTNYGSGFTIMFRLKENPNSEEIENFKTDIRCNFRCTIREQFAGVITYFVQEDYIIWSTVFYKLERLFNMYKQTLLEDYSVNEATLEDIFLKFEINVYQEKQLYNYHSSFWVRHFLKNNAL